MTVLPAIPAAQSPPTEAGLSDFDYELPADLIAQHPPAVRGESRLLQVSRSLCTGLQDHMFRELPNLLAPGDLLVMNDTRVIKARLFGRKASGGRIEAMVERIDGERQAIAMIRASHSPAIGSVLEFEGARARVDSREGAFFGLSFDVPVLDLLERFGALPLPPYIHHAPDASDEDRYQTVFARHPGAVAAPTAGLHLNEALLESLASHGIERAFLTLHVGAGTFAPIRDEDPDRHVMHSERYSIPAQTVQAITAARTRGSRIVALGTTSLRALESAALTAGPTDDIAAGPGETSLFIRPGFRFRVVDALITNFHLPRSTLMMLVSAFAGTDLIRSAYTHAVASRYRFFSYGDAMLLERAP